MRSTPHQLPPEGMLRLVVDTLLAESPGSLEPVAALGRAKALQRESERLAAAALASIGDLDSRELYALDGAGSTRTWLRAQPAGDYGQLGLAHRLRVRTVVRGALSHGTINTRAASSVCTALVTVDELDAGTGLVGWTGGGISEDQLHGVLAHAVPDVLQAWAGFDNSGADVLPDDDTDLRNAMVDRRGALAAVLLDAAEGIGLAASERLEPVFTLMARALSPNALSDALSTILHALEPALLESEDEAFEREMHFTLVKRSGRGWDLSGVLDDEDGQWLSDDQRARLKLLARDSDSDTDAHEAPDDSTDEPIVEHDSADTDEDVDAVPDAVGEPAPGGMASPGAASPADLTGGDAGDHDRNSPGMPSAEDSSQPPLFDDTEADPDTDDADADRFGAAGPGTQPSRWRNRRFAPVEGPPHDGGVIRKKGYAAFRMLLRDKAAPPGSGTPSPAHLTVVVKTAFLAGEPGAPHPTLDGHRLVELTRATMERLGCDSLLSAVILDAANRPLAASGTHRSFTRRERQAMRAQWGGLCAVNGCGLPGTIPHHVRMFSRTGQTCLEDGVPFCEGHHHDVHDGKRTLRLRDGRLVNEEGWVEPRLDQVA